MNSPIFQRSLDERRKQITRQLQRAMLYKQMEKAVAYLPTGIRDENKHNITFFHYKILFCYEFSDIPEKSPRDKKTNDKAIKTCYALQANGKSFRTFAYRHQGRKQTQHYIFAL